MPALEDRGWRSLPRWSDSAAGKSVRSARKGRDPAERKEWTASECSLWRNLQGPRLAVSLQGTEHVALSDWIWLAKDAVQTGPMGPQKTMSAVRDYVATFLDRTLRGEPADPLLSGGSPNYPDAKVTLQDQALCGKQ
jgi:hypothetical protein